MDSDGIMSAAEEAQRPPVAKQNNFKIVVLCLLGALSLASGLVLAFSRGVGSTREIRISFTITTPQNDRNREFKKSMQTVGDASVLVLVLALPPFLLIGADSVLQARWPIRHKFACWTIILGNFGIACWCAYRFGAHVGRQMPDWAI